MEEERCNCSIKRLNTVARVIFRRCVALQYVVQTAVIAVGKYDKHQHVIWNILDAYAAWTCSLGRIGIQVIIS